jgi:predicted nucleic acid-binding protein
MWRVVLDNAALTSALLNPHGSPARLLDYAYDGRLRLFTTDWMLSLEGRVLRGSVMGRRHGLSSRDVTAIIKELPVLLCLVPGPARQRSARRGMAAELLRCATAVHADFVVTSLRLPAGEVLQGGTQIVEADQLAKLVGRGV